MALAFNNVQQQLGLPGGMKLVTASITLDTSYPTGGTAGIAAPLGFQQKIIAFIPLQSLGYEFDYLSASDKLKVWNSTGAALNGPASEVANTTNLSGNVLPVLALGI